MRTLRGQPRGPGVGESGLVLSIVCLNLESIIQCREVLNFPFEGSVILVDEIS